MAALLNMGVSLMLNGQFEKALPLLERSLSVMRENLPGDHLDLARGGIICILYCMDPERLKNN